RIHWRIRTSNSFPDGPRMNYCSDINQSSENGNPKLFRTIDMILPHMTNHYGTLFAGNTVAFMVRVAFLTATRFCKQTVVLAGTEQIDCFVPIKEGSMIELIGMIAYTGRTSITVKVDLFSEDVDHKNRIHAGKGYFSLVAVDELGRPTSTEPYKPSSDIEKCEWRRVERFKEFRRQTLGTVV
ncbi:MAG: hotdog domain-containing protein, partial [Bdellovibrionia bacterium]